MKNLKNVLTVLCTCIVAVLLLTLVNNLTSERVAANELKVKNNALVAVLPEGQDFEEIALPDGAPSTVKQVYEETNGLGYVVKMATQSKYSTADMEFTVGIGTDGVIKGVEVTSYNDTKDFGTEYPESYIGADSALNGIDTFAGATFSSTAFKNAVSDAFSMLVANSMVSEGTKSTDTLVAELIPTVFPGATDYLGAAQLTEIEANGFTKAYKANNDSGYVVVSGEGDATVITVINAFGYAVSYDLSGNTVDNPEGLEGSFENLCDVNGDDNSKQALKALSEDISIEAITEGITTFDSVTGAFLATDADGNTYYVFNVKPFGYASELMEMVVVLDANGSVVNYRTVSDLILHAEYYTNHGLTDKEAYVNQFNGLTEDTYSDDLTIISGATFTTDAVSDSIHSAFNAFKTVSALNTTEEAAEDNE